MRDSIRANLLGYLSDALEDEDHALVQSWVDRDPQLSQDLSALKGHLDLLASDHGHEEPPSGLAVRTCDWIFSQVPSECPGHIDDEAGLRAEDTNAEVRLSEQRGESASRRRFSAFDLIVATVILVGAGVMFLPALMNAREKARLTACGEHLLGIGKALESYSDRFFGYLPYIPESGKRAVAGTVIGTLVHDEYLTDQQYLICGGSPVSQEPGKWLGVPTWDEIDNSDDQALQQHLWAQMSPSYGNYLGVRRGNQYVGQRNYHRPTFAIVADTPSKSQPGRMSLNHGGRVQNVLFEDGHIQRLMKGRFLNDDIFLNNQNLVEAGVNEADSVIGSSDSSPVRRRAAFEADHYLGQ
jgi:hypothetical protein